MGVKVREKPKGSGEWWVFINHNGVRKSKKIGKDKSTAHRVAKQLEARLTLKQFDMDGFNKKVPTLKQYAEQWFKLPHKLNVNTYRMYKRNLEKHVFPTLGDRQIDQIKRRDFKALFDKLLFV